MTKHEAFEMIASINKDLSWVAYRDEVWKIIDQIDQPPAEFSVREMVELMRKDQHTVRVAVYPDDVFVISRASGYNDFTVKDIDSLRAKLLELAKPPEPKTVMVEMSVDDAKYYASSHWNITDGCKTALEKAGVKL